MAKLKILVSIYIFASLIALPSAADASKVGLVSKHYAESGVKNYQKGDLSAAITDFSKAVMSDPGNDTARDYLTKIGMEKSIYGYYSDPAVEVAKLSQELNVVKVKKAELQSEHEATLQRCDELALQNTDLCRQAQEKQAQYEQAQIALNLLKQSAQQRAQLDAAKVEHYKTQAVESESKNETFERVTEQHKDVLGEQELLLQQKEEEIAALKKRVQLVRQANKNEIYKFEDMRLAREANFQETLRDVQARVVDLEISNEKLKQQSLAKIKALKSNLSKKEDELKELQGDLKSSDSSVQSNVDAKIALIKKKDGEITELKKRMVAMQEQVAAGRRQGNASDSGAKELQKQLTIMEDELKEKEMTLASKESDLEVLILRLSDAKERLELVDEILNEKDELIKELKSKLSDVQSQCQIQ